jgi:SAM-dependent methyltransferase
MKAIFAHRFAAVIRTAAMYKPTLGDIRTRIVNRMAGGLAIPWPRYITIVAGAPDVGHYLTSGRDSLHAITEMLVRNGLDTTALGDVLDFGCGSGRVLRHWHRSDGLRLQGSDYNPRLIAWCKRNYPFADFRINELNGPAPYPDESFDLIYAWSVFTHLTEELGDYWVAELARVLRPHGVLYATFHGEFYASWLSHIELDSFRDGNVVVHRGHGSGTNKCAAFHAPAAIRRKFGALFDVTDFCPGMPPLRQQDQYLLRKR